MRKITFIVALSLVALAWPTSDDPCPTDVCREDQVKVACATENCATDESPREDARSEEQDAVACMDVGVACGKEAPELVAMCDAGICGDGDL